MVTKLLASLVAVAGLGLGGYSIYGSATMSSDCCATHEACCDTGAACCTKNKVAVAEEAVDCCAVGGGCCDAGASCCGK